MCGIAGFLGLGQDPAGTQPDLDRMTGCIAHRGPDDSGTWIDLDAEVALGHRRLSIIDLSETGHQPMTSSSGRFVLTYNGEIYNFRVLRDELQARGYRFRGQSDTEVLLGAIETWGLDEALHRCVGMFSFALWDREQRELTLVRDRFGKKPLYYAPTTDGLLFASELKAIRNHPRFRSRISREALTLFFRYSCIPAPFTIYENAFKVPAGTILSARPGTRVAMRTYWSTADAFTRAQADPFNGTEEEAVERLHDALRVAVSQRMISDVPIGAFLSGGIDSSAIAALMQENASTSAPVRTFTIGSHELGYNEAEKAKRIAQHLGTDHTEMYVSPAEAAAVIPRLSSIYDEPFADSSQIPTFIISELTRRHVKVALSGDGGDEMFGGYNRYLLTKKAMHIMKVIPSRARHAVGRALLQQPASRWEGTLTRLSTVLPRELQIMAQGQRLHKMGEALLLDDPDALYLRLVSNWHDPASVVIEGGEPEIEWTKSSTDGHLSDPLDRMMLRDAIGYLSDDILVKVDRASMAVSLEVRAPLLDHRVATLAWSLPSHMKVRNGQGKRVLRRLLDRYVPPSLLEGPKMGFAVPVGEWLRHDLRDWAEDLLAPERLRAGGFLRCDVVRDVWQSHLEGPRDRHFELWAVLMFQSWLKEQESVLAA
jgi:asparagine synthase (glutamine-hydrolysing)